MDDPRTTQALRELAAMYLSSPVQGEAPAGGHADSAQQGPDVGPGDGEGAEREPNHNERADAELLVLGHLPGPSNLWANQYAQQRARQLGREVALARLAGGRLTLDWFALDPGAAAAGDGPPAGELATAADAVDALRRRHCLWLICLGEPLDAEALPLLGRVDRWTLLTGADEAAVVAAYRLLKQWLDRYHRVAPEAVEPTVTLATLGCTEAEAAEATEKIQRAAERFLTLAPRAGLHQQRMTPVHRRPLGQFPLDAETVAAMSELGPIDSAARLRLVDGQGEDTPASATEAENAAASQALWEQLLAEENQAGQTEALDPADDDEAAAAGAPQDDADDRLSFETPQVGPRVTAGEPESPPADAAEPQPRPEPADMPESLSRYVSELTPLRARCPRHESVELAADRQGRLHLLLWTGDAADPIRMLWETRQWVLEHSRLIALTSIDPPIEPTASPIVHLFTDAPKRYVSLAQRDILRLHALRHDPNHPTAPAIHVEIS